MKKAFKIILTLTIITILNFAVLLTAVYTSEASQTNINTYNNYKENNIKEK